MEAVKFSTLPCCRPYHPSSELRTQEGYYPNISPQQLRAASELLSMVKENGLNMNTDEEDEFLKLLRFLRARKFNVLQAFAMLKNDIEWREQDNRLNLRRETARDILQCDPGEIYKYFPTWIQGNKTMVNSLIRKRKKAKRKRKKRVTYCIFIVVQVVINRADQSHGDSLESLKYGAF